MSEIEPSGTPLADAVRAQIDLLGAAVAKLAEAAYQDPLTGLGNKAALQALAAAMSSSEQQRYSVLFVDLRGFKEINDRHGYEAADAGLAHVGRQLCFLAKEEPIKAFRYGGDEFVILLKHDDDAEYYVGVAWRLLSKFTFKYKAQTDEKPSEPHELELRSSIGWASPDGTALLDTLRKRAEAACKHAKLTGDKEPMRWTTALNEVTVHDSRRRCGSCGATTSVIVSDDKKHDLLLSRCANCQADFDASEAE